MPTKAELQAMIRAAKARIPDMQSPAVPGAPLQGSTIISEDTGTPQQPIQLLDGFTSGEPVA